METIWKYRVPRETPFTLSMPAGAEVLTVQMQDGEPHLWARVSDDAPPVERRFYIVGTGYRVPGSDTHYLGTWQMSVRSPESEDETLYVFHLFETSPLAWGGEKEP